MNLIAWDDYAQDRWRRGAGPGEPGQMSLPVDRVFLHHTVTRVTDDPVADAGVVNDVDQGRFNKVSYSWLVHEPSSSWIECEGLHRGAHTIDNAGHSLNYTAFGVGVIGNYQNDVEGVPTIKPSSTLLTLIADGIREYVLPHVKTDWTLLGHRDVYATACCGDLLYPHLAVIRKLIDHPGTSEEELTPAQDMILHDLQNRALTDVERDSLFGPDNGMYARLRRVEDDLKDQAALLARIAAKVGA
jgi:hypothetical protein